MLEYEKKVMLSETEYLTLMRTMCHREPGCIQTNYYFDTDDLAMNKKGITCRIRSKNGRFETTVKSHGCETDISSEQSTEIRDAFGAGAFLEMGLHLQGSLITQRTAVYSDGYCEAVLDRNTYLGCTDYELEIEYMRGCDEQATRLLQGIAGILLAENRITNTEDFCKRAGRSQSKSERFFRRKMVCGSEEMR